jgi:glyceraldehyde 3-phosphate dehydrogenase
LRIGDHDVILLHEPDPRRLPWGALHVDLVFECTGAFARRKDLVKHVEAGARFVILSAPARGDDIETIVHGVNAPPGAPALISCASCTTNCITPLMEILGRRLGVRKAAMTTVHAYTSSQRLVDGPHKRLRRGRAAGANLVPTSTGAAAATTRALPEFRGRFDGVAVRAPVAVGSRADIVVLTARPTTVDEVNRVFVEEAGTDRYRGVVGVTTDPFVSSDIIGDSRASVVDAGLTQVIDGDLVKLMSWYDNEWGYASQMVREAQRLARGLDVHKARSTPGSQSHEEERPWSN